MKNLNIIGKFMMSSVAFSVIAACCSVFGVNCPIPEPIAQQIVKINEARMPTFMVANEIKRNCKDKERTNEYTQVKLKYKTAQLKGKSWNTLLKIAIVTSTQLDNTDAFKASSEDTSKALQDFNSDALQLLESCENSKVSEMAKSSSSLATVLLMPIVDVLIQSGVQIWKASKDESDRQRQNDANFIENELQWVSWDDIEF